MKCIMCTIHALKYFILLITNKTVRSVHCKIKELGSRELILEMIPSIVGSKI